MHAKNGNSHTTSLDDETIHYSDLEPDEEHAHSLVLYGNRLLKHFGVKVVPHPALEEEESDECEFDVRVTYVPDDVLAANTEPDLVEVRLVTLGANVWQRTHYKRLLSSLVLLVLCILLVGVSLFGHTPFTFLAQPQATQTTGFTRNDTFPPSINRVETNHVSAGSDNAIIVNAGAMPQYCPAGTLLGRGRQIGNFPVWLSSGIDSETPIVHLPALTLKTLKGWKGWVVHIHLSGRYKYLTTISLNVLNIYGSTPPLLHNPYTATDSQRLFIDAKHPMGFQGASSAPNIGTWDIPLYLPTAGCYALSASWGEGHWLINFAAGQ